MGNVIDIRTCNLCVQRSRNGRMHYCDGCSHFICTRNQCISAHAVECGAELPAPTLAKNDAQMKRELAAKTL